LGQHYGREDQIQLAVTALMREWPKYASWFDTFIMLTSSIELFLTLAHSERNYKSRKSKSFSKYYREDQRGCIFSFDKVCRFFCPFACFLAGQEIRDKYWS
jgi:hypothetical protein